MAKRSCPTENTTFVEITNGRIKGYHEFGIKLPVGAHVDVEREKGNQDPFSLLCKVPCDLDERFLGETMRSSSKKTSYKVRDVIGRPLGRVQYFLNKTFAELMEEKKVVSIKGYITGTPHLSHRSSSQQKWKKNVQMGGGVVIPCKWQLVTTPEKANRVVEILGARLPDVENYENMEIKKMDYKRSRSM